MPASWVNIDVNGENMEGYITRPEGDGSHPAIVVIQEIWGVNSHIQSVVDRLPSLGYVGLAPAMFHREGPMTTGLHEELDTAIGRMRNCTDQNILADVTSAVDYLKSQSFVRSDKIGIVGFCYGGRVTYLSACNISDLSAAVVFYGGGIGMALGDGASPLAQTANMTCPVLGLFGDEDANPTPEDVATIAAALNQHDKAHEFHSYAGAGHGFHCEARASYREEAAKDAWGRAVAWFDKHLK